ncbi:DUF445 domain-containing protein [Domibacillus aminovorans]|uniref:DUF445 domain-containing protein n=1 Tax=Domibacillus aminovorans TaxID=29332 RepID=A0A177L1M6_9BACI|nr:DUF445 domain-containing protein [Domibacillus aminovorans]OAH59292.1 hypothetical protein AWH49_18605 [Domibacillus aminovorans]
MTSKKSKQSKHLASFSLAVMGTGFATTIPFHGSSWIDVVHGGFEAGLVGGLADWFAVTALFRHPLGIPIPHTALLPKNRNKMIKALVSTLENDWLSKESIQDKLQKIQFTEKIFPILEKELHSESARKGLVSLADQLIRSVQVEKIAPFIEKELKFSLSSIEINGVLQSVVDQVLIHEYDEKVFDYVLSEAEQWAKRESTGHQLGSMAMQALNNIELDGFMQFALKSVQNLLNEEKLGSILQNLLLNVVSHLRQKEDPNRKAFLLHVRKKLRSIEDKKEWLEEIENWKQHLLAKWEPAEKITEILQRIQQKTLAFIQSSEFMDTYVLPFLTRLLNNLKEDPIKNSMIENGVQKQIAILVEDNHSKIGKLVQENLDKLDNDKLVFMMENNIGKDLQWIRVNGAVCGFMIGIVLTGIKALIY